MRERRPAVAALAGRAFVRRHATAWYDAQCLLYHWNVEELERTEPVTDLSRLVRQVLRNTILEVQYRDAFQHVTLECWDDFDRTAALKELQDAALAHRITEHPLLDCMAENGLSPESLSVFLQNYYVNNRVFHLHVAAQSLSAPLEMRVEMYQNLCDELGRGRFERAHPILFLNNFKGLGSEQVLDRPLGGALNLLNTKIYLTFLSGDFRLGVGGLGFLELTMPDQMRKLYRGVLNSGVTTDDALFWKIHIDLDQEHGENWMSSMAPYVQNREQALSVLRGGLTMVEARARFYDSVWQAIPESRYQRFRDTRPVGATLTEKAA